MPGDTMDDYPVDFFVVMHGNITKAHRLFQLLGQAFRDDIGVSQYVERLAHGIRWRHIQVGNEVCAKVHPQLHGPAQIEGDDILEIGVLTQRVRIGRTFLRDALETATQGFKLMLDYFPIPCPSPFSKDSCAIWEVVCLIEEVPADQVGVARPAAQQSFSMPEDLA